MSAPNRGRDQQNLGKLTVGMERALLICKRDGRLFYDGVNWIGEFSRLEVLPQTVEALFDRHLLLAAYGGEKRRLRHSARLTPTGVLVTDALHEMPRHKIMPAGAQNISEESARFIQQVVQ